MTLGWAPHALALALDAAAGWGTPWGRNSLVDTFDADVQHAVQTKSTVPVLMSQFTDFDAERDGA